MTSTASRALASSAACFNPDSPTSEPMSISSSPQSVSSVSRVSSMNGGGSSSIPSTPRESHGSSEISSPALLSRHFAHHNYTMQGKWKGGGTQSHMRSNKHMEERPTRLGGGVVGGLGIPILNLGQAKAFAGSGSMLSSDNTPSPLSTASSSLFQSPSLVPSSLQSPSSFLHSSSPSLQSPSSASGSSSSTSADWLGSFQFSDTLIIGSTGSIRTGIHETTRAMTTIVMLDKKGQPKGGRHVKNILFQMKNDEHPHLLKLHEVLETWNRFYLIMEYASGGSLISHITSHGALSRDESIRLTAQLVDVIAYQQHRHTTYMDIGNVMLDHEMDIQMMDARIPTMIWADQPVGPKPSHPHCVAPEILTGGTDLSKCDIWNIGILFYIMLTGSMPFGDDAMTMKRLHHGSWIPNQVIDTECETLLNILLNPEPTARPTIMILTQHPLFRDHTFAPIAIPSSTSSTQRSLASTPSVSDVMMTDVEEEPESGTEHIMERKPSTGVAALQSRLDHLHELAVMSPQRRISAASVLPSSIFVPQSDPPTPGRSKAPSLTASPVTHKRSVSLTNAALSQTGSPHSFRRSLPLSGSGSLTNSPREPNRRLSMGPTPSSRTRVVLINESNGDEAIWRPTIVPSPAIPSPQSITVKPQSSMEFTGRALSADPSPKKLPIDPMYASPRISARPLKAFTPSFRSPETSPRESPVSSRPATPHPAIPASEELVLMTATPSTELMRPMAQRHEMDNIIPVVRHGDMLQELRPIQRHAEMISELAHLSIDAPVMTPRTSGRSLDRSGITLTTIPPITTVTTPRIQPPPARSSFSLSSTPPAATCPMPSRRLSTAPTITHDDVHIRIKAQPQHGHLTTSIYHMELQDSLKHVYDKLIHIMNDMGIRYHKDEMPIPSSPTSMEHIEMECELTPCLSPSPSSPTPSSPTPSHIKFHLDLRPTNNNHTMIRMDHVFGSFDSYRHTFNMIRNAMMKDEEKTTTP